MRTLSLKADSQFLKQYPSLQGRRSHSVSMKPDKHRWKCVPRRNRLRIQHEAILSDSRYIHTTSLTYPFNSASTPTSPLTPVLLPTRNAVIQSLSGLSCCLPLFLPDQLEYSQPLSPSQTLSGLYPSVIMYSSSVIHYISPPPLVFTQVVLLSGVQ